MIRACTDYRPVPLKQLVRDEVLLPSEERGYCPEPGDPCQDGSGVTSKRVKWG
jgi:hypothetical protein